MRRRIFIRIADARWKASKRAHVTDLRRDGSTHSFQHIQADSLSFDQFLIGGFTDPGKGYDVALCIAASLEEDPKLPVAYHGIGLLCVSG